jgi:hypothetical protein
MMKSKARLGRRPGLRLCLIHRSIRFNRSALQRELIACRRQRREEMLLEILEAYRDVLVDSG